MKRAAPFAVRSNRIRSHAFRFLMECIWKFGSKNVAFLTSQMLTFFSNEFPSAFHQKSKDMVFFAYYFSHQKGIVCFKWAAPSFLRFFMTDAKTSHIFSDRS